MAGPTGPGSTSISRAFDAARDANRGAFVPFLTAGFPSAAESERLAAALCDEGADVLELGVPFSDPLADGAVIQATTRIALEAGATLESVFALAGRIRARGPTPIVLMTYMNPIARFGVERVCDRAAAAGIDGIILVDLPPEEEPATWAALDAAGIDTITMVAPTTHPDRLRTIAARARGFLYVVARLGVTGKGGEETAIAATLDHCARATALPRCIGFGITPETDLSRYRDRAEGVVAGSCLLEPLLASHAAAGASDAPARERTLRELAGRFRARLAGWRRG